MTAEQPDTAASANIKSAPKPNNRLEIWTALAAVASFWTCSLMAPAGLVLSILLLRKRRSPLTWLAPVYFVALSSVCIYWFWLGFAAEHTTLMPDAYVRQCVNRRMIGNTLLPFPPSAHNFRFNYSSLLAANFYVRCEIPREDFDQWAAVMGVGAKEVGNEPGMVKLATLDGLDKLMGQGRIDDLDRYEKVFTAPFDWWAPETIQHGRYVWLAGRPPPAGGLFAYYDYDTNVLYFFWHWS